MLLAAVLLLAGQSTGGSAALLPRGWSALCPPKTRPDEIVVCTNRDPPPSPYRAPIAIPREIGERGTASVSAERNRLLGPDAGTVGTCSGIGPSGPFGCSYQRFKDNVNQAAGSRDPRGRVYERVPQ
ncbi:hypothetical protein [Sandarakinorhabdus sp.]|jgi:hypothetical protein|uniref:hypothetical protein n=1 Tax=Sandarakinorhabdus sp. TaxID=1916663 RepID=UPI00334209F5